MAADLELLGLTFPRLKATGHAHAVELLDGWKADVLKPAWKRAALATHPDRNPGDPNASSRFEACKSAYDRLNRVNVPKKSHRSRLNSASFAQLLADVGLDLLTPPSSNRKKRRQRFNRHNQSSGDRSFGSVKMEFESAFSED